jgi:hypothetical protein
MSIIVCLHMVLNISRSQVPEHLFMRTQPLPTIYETKRANQILARTTNSILILYVSAGANTV